MLLALTGCESCEDPPTPRELSTCQRASAHLDGCFGGASELFEVSESNCDADAAERLLEMSCDQLEAARAADYVREGPRQRFEQLVCRAGVRRFCVPDACRVDDQTPVYEDCARYLELDVDDCDRCLYYLCRDRARASSCGVDGYYEAYAVKYCRRITGQIRERMTPRGQQWLDYIRRCLPAHIETRVSDDDTCEAVLDEGVTSHERCFLDGGVCSLSFRDWMAFSSGMDPWDTDLYSITTNTTFGCLQQWVLPEVLGCRQPADLARGPCGRSVVRLFGCLDAARAAPVADFSPGKRFCEDRTRVSGEIPAGWGLITPDGQPTDNVEVGQDASLLTIRLSAGGSIALWRPFSYRAEAEEGDQLRARALVSVEESGTDVEVTIGATSRTLGTEEPRFNPFVDGASVENAAVAELDSAADTVDGARTWTVLEAPRPVRYDARIVDVLLVLDATDVESEVTVTIDAVELIPLQ